MEKAKHREQAVSCASAQVTDQVFMHQRDLRKSFIEQIHVDRILKKKCYINGERSSCPTLTLGQL